MQDERAGQGLPATGETRVDEALGRLGELAGLPVTEHPAVFEQLHRRLREVLGELDSGVPGESGPDGSSPGGPGPGGIPGSAGSQRGPDR
jgi:hypothetical protein